VRSTQPMTFAAVPALAHRRGKTPSRFSPDLVKRV
jgi:hypothetical protein